jgi:transcriptional antiterminator RfaH
MWFTEALFPNYLFARFDMDISMRQVQHTPGVSGIIHFGGYYPPVPDEIISEMRAAVCDDGVRVIQDHFDPGTPVLVSGGAFNSFRAVVTRVMPSRQRVAVLLELLGRQSEVEMPANALLAEVEIRARL